MKKFFILVLFSFILAFGFNIFAQKQLPLVKTIKRDLQKVTVNPSQSLINIGNVTSWVRDDGFHDWVVASSWNGAFPSGSSFGAIFSEGIVWGGQVYDGSSDPVVRVNGNTYGSGCSPITRLYRVRTDYLNGDLTSDAASFYNKNIVKITSADVQELKDQYQADWNEWPVYEGAPFEDINNDGFYNPYIDIPGVPGASQTIFIKYNDYLSQANYGSPPIGLEISETYWAYGSSGELSNVIFKQVKIIYKGTPNSSPTSHIDSMYIVQWADPDVGSSTDDFAGCDTTLNLGYAYNSTSNDNLYSSLGLQAPAVGYSFLQGVSKYTGNSSDSARFHFKWNKGYKYVNRKPMSGFVYFGGEVWPDPYFNYTGTLQFYNLMRGYSSAQPYGSLPFPSIVADYTADGAFLLAGDPVTGTGKIDGLFEGPRDRRIMITNGPFSMNLGDTVEVVIAEVVQMPESITDPNPNLASVKNLKESVALADAIANDKTAAVIFGPEFAVVGNEVDFTANFFPVDGHLNSSIWAITKKPIGSNAQLTNVLDSKATFNPDIAGEYEITLIADINNIIVSYVKKVTAVINNTPIASLEANKTQIIWGDSILVDYSKSYDADNDNLIFELSGPGIFNYDYTNKKAYFYPDPSLLGKVAIDLRVSDKYSVDTATVKIFIDPKLENITINYSYIDPDWDYASNNLTTGLPYFIGNDSLYIPMMDGLRRYEIYNDSISLKEKIPQITIDGIWSIKNDLLWGANRYQTNFLGTIGKMSIFDLNNSANTILSGYLPGSIDITNIYKLDAENFLQDYYGNLFKVDFSTPSSPQILSSVELNSPNRAVSRLLKFDSNSLYFLFRDYSRSIYTIKTVSRNDLNFVNDTDLPFSLFWQITTYKDKLVLKNYSGSGNDTLYFYQLDNLSTPVLLSKIYEPDLFPDPYPQYANWSVGFIDDLLVIGKYSSFRIFNISDLNNPKFVGTWYGGGLSLQKRGNNYFVIRDLRLTKIDNPYSGINKVTLDLLSDVNDNSTKYIPDQFRLEQNYPNPFNPSTTIRFSIAEQSPVSLKVYNILGKEIATLVNDIKGVGQYEVNFDGKDLSSGVYFYTLKTNNFTQTRKMILMK